MAPVKDQPIAHKMKSHPPVKPPFLANKLLHWYCMNAKIEDLEGDLEELFVRNLGNMSARRAKLRYWKDVASLIFSYAIKKRKQHAAYPAFSLSTFHSAMLKNYFIVASRNLRRHEFFTIINTLGLATGMSISLLLIAMLSFLWRYDNFHVKKDNIYRIISTKHDRNSNEKFASAPSLLAADLKDNYSGIDQVIRINANLSGEADYEGKQVPLHGYFTDHQFLQVFTFPLLKGNIQTALAKPNALVITQSASRKIFAPGEDPVGKVVAIPPFGDFEITGVLKDPPRNSHLDFEIIGSWATFESLQRDGKIKENSWGEFRDSYVYLLLPDSGNPEEIETFLSDITTNVFAKETDFKVSFRLQALNDITPGEELHNDIGPSWAFPYIFAFLTLMILLPACFNYANISISRALKRMKEIGLRKTMGGQKSQIFIQFITESVVTTFIALIVASGMFYIIRDQFLVMLVDGGSLQLELDLQTGLYFILFALSVGILAGTAPALYFAKLTPIHALKTKPTSGGLVNLSFRKFLVVSQFALSLGFIMSVVIALKQYQYTVNYDLGFNQENILDVQLQQTNPEIVKNEFSKLSSVHKISMSSDVLGTTISGKVQVKNPEHSDSAEVFQMFVDEQFISNLGLTLLAGGNFTHGASMNEHLLIVNEEFLKAFGLSDPHTAPGQTFLLDDHKEMTVIGVVKNFHYTDLSVPIKSFFFRYDPDKFAVANIKMSSTDIFSALSEMESVWKKIEPDRKFTAKFFEDELSESYSIYFSMIKICGFLGFLAITISCLGLLGMVVFTVENRVKEIGIRKVMGASEMNVVLLLSRHFGKLMMIAALIAVPIAWMFFEKVYLRAYYYRISVGLTEIGVSVFFMMALGLVTILSQTMRAARANPVDSLRSE